MKTTGVSCVTKFRLLVFLGHPNVHCGFVKLVIADGDFCVNLVFVSLYEAEYQAAVLWGGMD